MTVAQFGPAPGPHPSPKEKTVTPPNVMLSGIVGSTAYGLAHAGSDIDLLGVFAAPTVELHGLHRPKESHVTTGPDSTFHEAAKAVRLILGCNPTATEILWLPSKLYGVRTPLGEELIGIRDSLLSERAARNAFLGYATQQFRKLQARGDGTFGSDVRNRSLKHARHLIRLVEQGTGLHQTGRLTIRLPDPERVRSRAEEILARPAVGERLIADAEAVFDKPGVLPTAPDEAAAEAWLRRVRRAFYAEGAGRV